MHGIDCLFDEFKDCATCEANPHTPAQPAPAATIEEVTKRKRMKMQESSIKTTPWLQAAADNPNEIRSSGLPHTGTYFEQFALVAAQDEPMQKCPKCGYEDNTLLKCTHCGNEWRLYTASNARPPTAQDIMVVLEDDVLANVIILRHADISTGRWVLDDYRAAVKERLAGKVKGK